MMVRTFQGRVYRVGVTALLTILCASAATAACVGDCNGNGSVTAGELTKIISIINLCDGVPAGCTAIPGTDKQCTNADRNGNGVISAAELTLIISNINSFATGCPPDSGSPTAAPTQQSTPTRTVQQFTPTPTVQQFTPTPTVVTGPPLGDRVFSLGPGSGFFSSLAASVKAGVPAGSLTLSAGPMDENGHSQVTLGNPGTVIRTDIALGGLTLCTKIDSCTGTLYCNGGAFVDVLNSLDSLKSGMTCVRDGMHSCPSATPSVCCSNSCEGVGVGSGNSPVQVSPPPSTTPTDRGSGAMLLMCTQRSATVTPIGDCSKADFTSAKPADQWYTTGIDTAQVTNHCAGSGAPSNKVPKLARQGTSFSCTDWATENGKGVLAFTIPSEEGSAAITGDGANGGLWSDQ